LFFCLSLFKFTKLDLIFLVLHATTPLTFIKNQANPEFDFPDTIRFRNGAFHTKVFER